MAGHESGLVGGFGPEIQVNLGVAELVQCVGEAPRPALVGLVVVRVVLDGEHVVGELGGAIPTEGGNRGFDAGRDAAHVVQVELVGGEGLTARCSSMVATIPLVRAGRNPPRK